MRYVADVQLSIPLDPTLFAWVVEAGRVSGHHDTLVAALSEAGIPFEEEMGRITVAGSELGRVRDLAASLDIPLSLTATGEMPASVPETIILGVPAAVQSTYGSLGVIRQTQVMAVGAFNPADCAVYVMVRLVIKI
jgi:hypothetical protein